MQFTTVLALLTALATSAHAAIPPSYQVEDFQDPFSAETFIGTFDTFVDPGCSVGGRGITVDSVKKAGLLPSNVISVKAYIQDQKCSLKIYGLAGQPTVIRPGTSECVLLPGHGMAHPWVMDCA